MGAKPEMSFVEPVIASMPLRGLLALLAPARAGRLEMKNEGDALVRQHATLLNIRTSALSRSASAASPFFLCLKPRVSAVRAARALRRIADHDAARAASCDERVAIAASAPRFFLDVCFLAASPNIDDRWDRLVPGHVVRMLRSIVG
jgi:hypothetical protein